MHLLGQPLDRETARQRRDWKFTLAAPALIVAGSLVSWMFLIAHGVQTHFAIEATRPAVHVGMHTGQVEPVPLSLRVPAAKETTPRDVPIQTGLVWVNTASGIYHYPGSRWYGRTAQGKYASEDEAAEAGDRAAANERRPGIFESAQR